MADSPSGSRSDRRSDSDLLMSGGGSGLGVPAPGLAGYLGKVQEQFEGENCPWCAARGKTSALRSYHNNLPKPITLCSSLQCLFPLVSQPLEDVLDSLILPGAKRKNSCGQSEEPSSKHLRWEEEEASLQNGNVPPTSKQDHTGMDIMDKHTQVQDETDMGVLPEQEAAACSSMPSLSSPVDPATVEPILSPRETVLSSDNREEVTGYLPCMEAGPAVVRTVTFLTEDFTMSHRTVMASVNAISTSDKTVVHPMETTVKVDPTPEERVVPQVETAVKMSSASEERVVPLVKTEALGHPEAGSAEAGSAEAGSAEAGSAEAGSSEAGSSEAGSSEAANGSRLELDALPHPVCSIVAPAQEVHVFRERELLDQSPNLPQSDSSIVEVSTACNEDDVIMDTTVVAEESIGSTAESVSKNDIVMLTLVNKVDSEVMPLDNDVLATSLVPCEVLNCSSVPEPIRLLDQSHNFPTPQDNTGIAEAVTMDTTTAATLISDFVTPNLVEVKVDSEGEPLVNDSPVRLSSSCEVSPPSVVLETPLPALEPPHESSSEAALSVVPCELPDCPANPEPIALLDQSQDIPVRQDEALKVSDSAVVTMDATAASIGSTNWLMEAFDGLSHSDIVTLTLREIKVDSERKPLDNDDTPVCENGPSSSCELSPCSVAPDTPCHGSQTPHETLPEPALPVVPCDLVLQLDKNAPSEVPSVQIPPSVSLVPSTKHPAHPWFGLYRNPARPHQSTPTPTMAHPSTPTLNTQTKTQSKPIPVNLPPPHRAGNPLRRDIDGFPRKPASMYGGFSVRNTNMHNAPKTVPQHSKVVQRQASGPVSQSCNSSTKIIPASVTSPPTPGVTELLKTSSKEHSSCQQALRDKLLKKLKAKKKKLERLNQKLGYQRGVAASPELGSPHTVSSSTSAYDTPAYDQSAAYLLLPETTASNLSPDSTGFQEMMANGQEGSKDTVNRGSPTGGAVTSQQNNLTPPSAEEPMTIAMTPTNDNFLDEFISMADLHQQTDMETEALSALDLFF